MREIENACGCAVDANTRINRMNETGCAIDSLIGMGVGRYVTRFLFPVLQRAVL